MAGVSAQYLTRLEQGVDRHPSPQVLDALATALRLDADARAHLHALAGPAAPRHGTSGARSDLQPLLDAWGGTPAYARDRFFDVLAANKPAMLLAPFYHPDRNLVRDMFLEPAARALFPHWPDIAAQTVAAFDASTDDRFDHVRRCRTRGQEPKRWALRVHQSAKVRGVRPRSCRTVSVRKPVVSARMRAKPSMRASASAGGAPCGKRDRTVSSGEATGRTSRSRPMAVERIRTCSATVNVCSPVSTYALPS
ncbi:MAG TPA: helix-turn-helix transcriptional regulator [Actinoplanes sp.]